MRVVFTCGAVAIAVWLAVGCSLTDVDELKGSAPSADSGTSATDAGDADSTDADADVDAGEGATCSPGGATCQSFDECCSQTCVAGACSSCSNVGDSCTVSSDCCDALSCYNGACAGCSGESATCTTSDDCCSGICGGGACQACGALGEDCSSSAPCCALSECKSGKCSPTTCLDCINANCAQELADCVSTQDCANAWSCQLTCTCGGGDVQTCAEQCNANNQKFLTLGLCALTQSCQEPCMTNMGCQ